MLNKYLWTAYFRHLCQVWKKTKIYETGTPTNTLKKVSSAKRAAASQSHVSCNSMRQNTHTHKFRGFRDQYEEGRLTGPSLKDKQNLESRKEWWRKRTWREGKIIRRRALRQEYTKQVQDTLSKQRECNKGLHMAAWMKTRERTELQGDFMRHIYNKLLQSHFHHILCKNGKNSIPKQICKIFFLQYIILLIKKRSKKLSWMRAILKGFS